MTTSTTSSFPVLHLNADFTPMSVFPLSTMNWQDAVRGIFGRKLYAVAEYDEMIPTVDPRNSIRFPSVVVSNRYVPKNLQAAAFNRENIWLRDRGVLRLLPGSREPTGANVRPRPSEVARRPDDLGEHRLRLPALQHGEGEHDARQIRKEAAAQAMGSHGLRARAQCEEPRTGGAGLLPVVGFPLLEERNSPVTGSGGCLTEYATRQTRRLSPLREGRAAPVSASSVWESGRPASSP